MNKKCEYKSLGVQVTFHECDRLRERVKVLEEALEEISKCYDPIPVVKRIAKKALGGKVELD